MPKRHNRLSQRWGPEAGSSPAAGPSLSGGGSLVPVKHPSTSQGAAHRNRQNPSGNRVYFKHRNLAELLHVNAKIELVGDLNLLLSPAAVRGALDN